MARFYRSSILILLALLLLLFQTSGIRVGREKRRAELAVKGRRPSNQEKGIPVHLNVYDLSATCKKTLNWWLDGIFGLALFHVSVVVYDTEWTFGVTDQPGEGIFSETIEGSSASARKEVSSAEKRGHVFNRRHDLGYANVTREQVTSIIDGMQEDFTGPDYDMLRHNCGHFSTEFAKRLGGLSVPSWATKIAALAATLEPIVTNVRAGAAGSAAAIGDVRATIRNVSTRASASLQRAPAASASFQVGEHVKVISPDPNQGKFGVVVGVGDSGDANVLVHFDDFQARVNPQHLVRGTRPIVCSL